MKKELKMKMKMEMKKAVLQKFFRKNNQLLYQFDLK